MLNFRMLKLSDLWLWGSVGLLCLIGLFAIFSATQGKFIYINRQLFSLLAGLIGLIIFMYIDYKHFKRWSLALYFLMLLMLLAVLFLGSSGAQRWIEFGPFSFQPSEVSKIFMIICLAAYLSDHKKLVGLWHNVFRIAKKTFFLTVWRQ